jgi:hypothetical protein
MSFRRLDEALPQTLGNYVTPFKWKTGRINLTAIGASLRHCSARQRVLNLIHRLGATISPLSLLQRPFQRKHLLLIYDPVAIAATTLVIYEAIAARFVACTVIDHYLLEK